MRNTSDIKYFGEVLKWLKSLASNTSRSVTRREGSNPSFSAEKERKTFFSSCALFHISIIHYKSSRYWISQTDLPLPPISRIMLTATITAPTIKITSPMFCPAKSIQLWKFTPGLTTLLLYAMLIIVFAKNVHTPQSATVILIFIKRLHRIYRNTTKIAHASIAKIVNAQRFWAIIAPVTPSA